MAPLLPDVPGLERVAAPHPNLVNNDGLEIVHIHGKKLVRDTLSYFRTLIDPGDVYLNLSEPGNLDANLVYGPNYDPGGMAFGIWVHRGNQDGSFDRLDYDNLHFIQGYNQPGSPDAPYLNGLQHRIEQEIDTLEAMKQDPAYQDPADQAWLDQQIEETREEGRLKFAAHMDFVSIHGLHQSILDTYAPQYGDLITLEFNVAGSQRETGALDGNTVKDHLTEPDTKAHFSFGNVETHPLFQQMLAIREARRDAGQPDLLSSGEINPDGALGDISRDIIALIPDAARMRYPIDATTGVPEILWTKEVHADILARSLFAEANIGERAKFDLLVRTAEFQAFRDEIYADLNNPALFSAGDEKPLNFGEYYTHIADKLAGQASAREKIVGLLDKAKAVDIVGFDNADQALGGLLRGIRDDVEGAANHTSDAALIGKYAVTGGALAFGGLFAYNKYKLETVDDPGKTFGEWAEEKSPEFLANLPFAAGLFGGAALLASTGPVGWAFIATWGVVGGYLAFKELVSDYVERTAGETDDWLRPYAVDTLDFLEHFESYPLVSGVGAALQVFANQVLVPLMERTTYDVKYVGGDAVDHPGEENAWLVGTEGATLFARDTGVAAESDDNVFFHFGYGGVKGGIGNDTIVAWRPDYIAPGEPFDPDDPESEVASDIHLLQADGGQGDDWIFKLGGETAELVGGAGEDWIVAGNAYVWGGEKGGTGDGERDDYWFYNTTIVEDAEVVDRAFFAGFPLLGGVVFDWQEKGHAYWSPGGTALTFALGAFSSVAGTVSLLATAIDVVAGQMVRYGRGEDGSLIAEFFGGRGGAAGFRNYEFDLKTGQGTAGIATFHLGFVAPEDRTVGGLQLTVDRIFQQAYGYQHVYGQDPLVLDLDGDGIEVGRYAASFDVTGDGFAEMTDWVWGGDGFLARDLDGNGQIDDITELFGDAETPAFTALAALDSNSDGIIDVGDAAFTDLSVWVDADRDGVTDAGELQDLATHGIASIDLAATDVTDVDVRGNAVRATSTFTRSDGTTGAAADVLLNSDLTDTRWLGDSTVSAEAAATLGLKGYGRTKNLDVAMTGDATLLGQVESFATASGNDWAVFRVQVEDIFLRWTGADQVTAAPMGLEFDERKLAALETWLGYELSPRDGNGDPIPSAAALEQIEESYADILDELTIKLAVQGPLAGVFAGAVYDAQTDRVTLTTAETLPSILTGLLAGLPADAAAAEAGWDGPWAPLLNHLFAVTDRADGIEIKDDYVIASLLAATEQTSSPLGLETLAEGLGIETAQFGGSGDDTLARTETGLQVLIGGAGDDALNGSGGQTVFVYGSDWGNDTITDGERFDTGDRIRFATFDETEVTLTRDGADLLITKNGASDSIRVVNQFGEVIRALDGSILSGDYGVEEIQFKSGTIWDFSDIFQAVGRGTSAAETLIGTDHGDWLEGFEGDDRLEGGNDGDVYFYSAGHGSDVIFDEQTDPLAAIQDAIVFEAGISFDDFEVSRDGASDDLVVGFGEASTDTITVEGQFWYGPLGVKGGDDADGFIGDLLGASTAFATDNRIETFVFQDGPPLTWHEVQQRLIGQNTTEDADTAYGFGSRDSFGSSAGDDLMVGFDGGDTYHFGRGSGNDTIEERAKYLTTLGTDEIVFGAGIAPGDVVFDRPSADPHLRMTIADTGETLTVKDQFDGFNADIFGILGVQWFDRIERFRFEDGTVLTWEDVLGLVTTGGDGDDALYGDHYADTLDGGFGNDHLEGRDDGDTYLVRANEGDDTILDNQEDLTTAAPDTLRFEGLAAADVTFSRDLANPDDLIATLAGGGSVTIQDHYKVDETWIFGDQGFDRIEVFEWTDVTKGWQAVEAELIAASKTAGDDTVLGTHYDDVLDGGAGNDTLIGGNGSDEYRFDAGGGSDVIDDRMDNILAPTADRLVLGAGLDHALARYTHDDDDLIIGFDGLSETIRIEDMFKFFDTGPFGVQNFGLIEEITFGDGTARGWVALMPEILAQAKTAGADTIEGFYFDDRLDGGAGDDLLVGGDGNDTYVFDVGYGHDTIREDRGSIFSGSFDTVEFGPGITTADIRITRETVGPFTLSPPDLIVEHVNGVDKLTIEDTFTEAFAASTMQEIEQFTFADGTVWDLAQIKLEALKPSAGADTLVGFGGADTLDGGAGDDHLDGRLGNDIYVFAAGYGNDTIRETVSLTTLGGADTVRLIGGIGPDDIDIALTPDGRDLIVTLLDANGDPTGDTLTIEDQYAFWYKAIERFEFSDAANTVWEYGDIVAAVNGAASTDGDDTIVGTSSDDILDGGFGDDSLEGKNGDDIYVFGAGYGQDTAYEAGIGLIHQTGIDTVRFIDGLALEDFVITRSDSGGRDVTFILPETGDSLTLNDGFGDSYRQIERYEMSERAADGTLTSVTYTLGTGPDSFEEALLAITNTAADETLHGFDYRSDTIQGGAGDDLMIGYDGADTYVWGLADGHDRIHDKASGIGTSSAVDRLEFGAGIDPDAVRLTRISNGGSPGEGFVTSKDNVSFSVDGYNASLTIVGQFYENIGTNYDQIEEFVFADGTVWTPQDLRDRLLAQASTDGDDTIVGFRQAETLDGGLGNDQLEGAVGSDTYLFGPGAGNDTVKDNHVVNLSHDTDVVRFTGGLTLADLTITRDGIDALFTVTASGEVLRVVDAYDTDHWKTIERYEFADGTAWTQADLIRFLTDAVSTDGDDVIDGFEGRDLIDGGLGDDVIDGQKGGDELRGGDGNDIIDGGIDPDSLYGGDGDDILTGGHGADLLDGGTGDDRLDGGDYGDTLFGGDGDDILLPGSGHDTVHGGAGNDTVDLSTVSSSAAAVFDLVAQEIRFAGYYTETLSSIENATGAYYAENTMLGTDDANILTGGINDDLIQGGGGNDRLIGGAGTDTLQGGDGDDWLSGGNDPDVFDGGAGIDTADFTYSDWDHGVAFDLAAGTVEWRNASGTLVSAETLTGIETIVSNASATATFVGDIHDNAFTGGDRDDTAQGGAGNDTLIGKGGADLLQGGTGSDTYVWSVGDGDDTLTEDGDAADTDTLRLDGVAAADVTLLRGGDTLAIEIAGAETLTVEDHFLDEAHGLETITLDDATLSRNDILAEALVAPLTDIRLSLDVLETGEYGNNFNGAWDADGLVTASFLSDGSAVQLDLEGYDIDFDDEIELLLNDVSLGHLEAGTNNGLSPYQFTIFAAQQIDGYNVIGFRQAIDVSYRWGVTDILLSAAPPADIALTRGFVETGEYGNDFNGASDPDGVITASFQGEGTDLLLDLSGYDIDYDDEVEILLNGTSLGYLDEGVDNGLSQHQIAIAASQQALGENVLSVRQAINATYKWGITDIALTPATASLHVDGGTDDDHLLGGGGDDQLNGDEGDDSLSGRGGSDTLDGGTGNDRLRLSESAAGDLDMLDGGAGTDTADFSGFVSALWVDLLYTGDEVWTKDTVDLATGTWRAIADLDGIENLIGSGGSDQLLGDTGDNVIDGDAGNDDLQGRLGSDTLQGADGDDRLLLSESVAGDLDTLDGGAGIDTADFSGFASAIWVDLLYTGDEVWTKDTADLATGTWRAIADLDGIENLIGSGGADQLLGDAGDNVIDGGAGDDTLQGRLGSDTLRGADGDDRLLLAESAAGDGDTLDGGAGIDTADFSGFVSAVWVDMNYSGDEVWTKDTANLSSGVWRAIADLDGIENIAGSDYADLIRGDAGDNVIAGGAGDDDLRGGGGADSFVFTASDGIDDIIDFQDGTDLIRFEGTGLAFADLTVTASGSDALVDYGTGTIRLDGVALSLLTENDFVFV